MLFRSVQVGQSALSVEEFEALLHSPQELRRAKYIAPAHGLALEGIEYPERFGLWGRNSDATNINDLRF